MKIKLLIFANILIPIFFFSELIIAQEAPDTLWTKIFGDSLANFGTTLTLTSDGGYIVGGGKSVIYGDRIVIRPYVIKFNNFDDTVCTMIDKEERGRIMWNQYVIPSIHQLSENRFVMAAGDWAMMSVIDMNISSGEINYFDFGADASTPDFCSFLPDSHLIISDNGVGDGLGCGYYYSIYKIKVGNPIVEMGESLFDDAGRCAQFTDCINSNDFNLIFLGIYADQSDSFLEKRNTSGELIWRIMYNFSDHYYAKKILQTKSGFVVLLNSYEPIHHSWPIPQEEWHDILLMKTNDSGDSLFTKKIGGENFDYAQSIQQTSDEGFIIVGSTRSFEAKGSDVWIVKTDAEFEVQWTKTINKFEDDRGNAVQQTSDGGYIIVGTTTSIKGDNISDSDIWVIRLAPDVANIEKEKSIPSSFSLSQNYPNPFNPITTIEFSLPKSELTTLKIYNTLGQGVTTLLSEKLNAGNYKYNWDASGMASGIYYYRLVAGEYINTKKLIVLK